MSSRWPQVTPELVEGRNFAGKHKLNIHNIEFRGLAVLSLPFPSGGSRSQSGEIKSTCEHRKNTPCLFSLLIFSNVSNSGVTCYFWFIFFKTKSFQSNSRSSLPHFAQTRRSVDTCLPFWCNIWWPGTEGSPLILCERLVCNSWRDPCLSSRHKSSPTTAVVCYLENTSGSF